LREVVTRSTDAKIQKIEGSLGTGGVPKKRGGRPNFSRKVGEAVKKFFGRLPFGRKTQGN